MFIFNHFNNMFLLVLKRKHTVLHKSIYKSSYLRLVIFCKKMTRVNSMEIGHKYDYDIMYLF